MKSIKIVAFIIGAIALFPSVSHAGNFGVNEQVVDLTTINNGSGNISDTTIRQENFLKQKAGRHGDNSAASRQAVTRYVENNGHENIDVKNIHQQYGTIQKSSVQKAK